MRTKRFLAGLMCAVMMLVAVGCDKQSDGNSSENDTTAPSETVHISFTSETGTVYQWWTEYLANNYVSCDSMTSEHCRKLNGFYTSDYAYASNLSIEFYSAVLAKSVDSIVEVRELNYTASEQTADTQLEITYHPYKAIRDYKLDTKGYEDICMLYLTNNITLDEFTEALADFVRVEFNNCFVAAETSEIMRVHMIEGVEYDRSVLMNADDVFLELLQKQNILPILEVFERDFKIQFDKAADGYVTPYTETAVTDVTEYSTESLSNDETENTGTE